MQQQQWLLQHLQRSLLPNAALPVLVPVLVLVPVPVPMPVLPQSAHPHPLELVPEP